jgi:hypothetical protein
MTLPRPVAFVRSAIAAVTLALLTTATPAPGAALFEERLAEDVVPELPLPADSRFFDVDLAAVRGHLSAAPPESFDSPAPGLTVALRLPDLRSEEFSVWETPLMHPDLAARYPEIKTYTGRGIDNPFATVRLTVTPRGFHGMILSDGPTVFIDPVSRNDNRTHASHFKSTAEQVRAGGEPFRCDFETDPVVEAEIAELVERRNGVFRRASTGQELRTYRARGGRSRCDRRCAGGGTARSVLDSVPRSPG